MSEVDLTHAHIAIDLGETELFHRTVATQCLNGARAHRFGRLGRACFAIEACLRQGCTGVLDARGVQDELTRRFQEHGESAGGGDADMDADVVDVIIRMSSPYMARTSAPPSAAAEGGRRHRPRHMFLVKSEVQLGSLQTPQLEPPLNMSQATSSSARKQRHQAV